MGIYIGPLEPYLGFGRKDVYEKWEGELGVFYELREFVGLLLNCNPNVLSLLWLKSNQIIHESPIGARLRERRDLFVTKRASIRERLARTGVRAHFGSEMLRVGGLKGFADGSLGSTTARF
jgi:predicted nucleotidyltransferase